MDRPDQPFKVFISYSRADAAHLTLLEKHLANLQHTGWIEPWTDRAFNAGDTWEPILLKKLQESDVVLIQVSAHSMASEFIQTEELPRILERHRKNEVRLVPIMVHPVDIKGSELDKLQCLPLTPTIRRRKPVSLWRNSHAAWEAVATDLRLMLETFAEARAKGAKMRTRDALPLRPTDLDAHPVEWEPRSVSLPRSVIPLVIVTAALLMALMMTLTALVAPQLLIKTVLFGSACIFALAMVGLVAMRILPQLEKRQRGPLVIGTMLLMLILLLGTAYGARDALNAITLALSGSSADAEGTPHQSLKPSRTPSRLTPLADSPVGGRKPASGQMKDAASDGAAPQDDHEPARKEQPSRTLGNAAGIRWITLPGGTFKMGTVGADKTSGEYPAHDVTLTGFKISKTEVTVAQYRACVDAGACEKPHWDDKKCRVYNESSWEEGILPQSFRGDDQPMVCVSWDDAKAYTTWLSKSTPGARLPTEAEWEYAARGSAGRTYPWGNGPAPSCDRAIHDPAGDVGNGCGNDSTWPVCSKEAGNTPEGLCDIAGNVWEWVEDWYASGFYRNSPQNNPSGPETGFRRVLRGGSWIDARSVLRGAYRGRPWPTDRDNNVGFRVVLSSAPSGAR